MKKIFNYLIIISVVFAGCRKKDGNRHIASHKAVVIERFDQHMWAYLSGNTPAAKEKLRKKFPIVLSAFGQVTINNSDPHKPGFFQSIDKYFSNPQLQKIYADAEQIFHDVTPEEKELNKADDLLSEILPGRKLPRLCMHVSGFKQNVMVTDSVISLSIDRYLGENYPIYKDFFYDYQRTQMKPEYVTRDYLRAFIMSSLLPESQDHDLLSAMIREGKCLYLLSKFLPERKAEHIIGYGDKEMKWCAENEKALWRTTIARKYLYSSDYMIIAKYMDEAAYTSLISPLSPGRVGAWIGWQIVENYAKNNPGSDASSIMAMDDHQLLKASKYNP